MKFIINLFYLIAVIAIVYSSNVIACENLSNSNQYFKKIYFALHQVEIQNNTLILFLEKEVTPIQNILSDANGFYTWLELDPLEAGHAPMGTWVCPRCYHTNSMWDQKCYFCSYPDKN